MCPPPCTVAKVRGPRLLVRPASYVDSDDSSCESFEPFESVAGVEVMEAEEEEGEEGEVTFHGRRGVEANSCWPFHSILNVIRSFPICP